MRTQPAAVPTANLTRVRRFPPIRAIEKTTATAAMTPDLGGKGTTAGVTAAVVKAL